MNRSRRFRLAMLLLTAMVFVLPTAASAGGPPPTQGVHLTPIGNPTWKPVDFHLFSAPIGTAASGYEEFLETALGLLPEPNHTFHPDLGVGPGDPHDPPYDQEMADGVVAQGYHEGVRFNQSEFSDGMGVWTAWMNVPYPGTTGSSPDFTSGPIIPNSIFPIHVNAVSTHNGAPYSDVFDGDVPALDGSICDNCAVDGHSHFPFFLADNADFGPPGGKIRGSYTWEVTMIDATGNGWQFDVHFAVAP
ncbi:MAG: hypothetical protein KDI55_27190 [Anaerolineae bacterium]|nr:hypothetical protein [Anaerolineae bacterium]